MSIVVPGSRTKIKTSGLSDFFGANGHQSHSARQNPKQLPASPSRISLPQSTQLLEPSSSAKSKKSSIPFWGKRKNPSPSPVKRKPAPSASPPPPVPRLNGSPGTNNGASSSSTVSPKDPPLPSRLPPINVSPPSLSSKFAAHFTPAPKTPAQAPVKSRGIYGSIHAPSPPISPSSTSFTSLPSPTRSTYRSISSPQSASTSAAAPISNSTRPSVESHRSSTSTTRPTTITVSISPPEDLYKDDNFMDKFTLPRSAPAPPVTYIPGSTAQKRPPGSRSSTLDNQGSQFDSASPSPETLSPSPPSSPKMQFPNPPLGSASQVSLSLYVQDKDSSKVDLNGSSNDSETSSILKSRRSMRKHSISVVRALEDALGTPLATDLDSDNESDSNTIPTSTSTSDLGKDLTADVGLRIPLRQSSLMMSAILQQQQPPPQQTEDPPKQPPDSPIPPSPSKVPSIKSSNSSIRSSVSPSQSGPPPTTPLPSPPSRIDSKDSLSSFSSLPTIPSMNSLPSRRSYALLPTGSVVPPRPRARTISTTPAPNVNLRAIPTASSRSLASSTPSSRRQSKRGDDMIIDDKSNKENKYKPTYEELELTLAELQGQYTTLTAYLKTVSEKLEREKAAAREEAEVWQKEADLWRHEAKSRSAEVKKKDIEIEGLKWLILHPMPPAERSRDEQDDDDASTEAGSLAPSAMFSNDSGSITDADSMRHEASRKRSMTIHDFRSSPQKPRWPKSTTHLQVSFSGNNSTTGLGLDYALPDVPYTKWTLESGISSSCSAASSTSSLAVPGLSATNTVSSGLSAIPESPPHRPVDADVEAEAQKQRDREERRSSRVLRRVSASSIASSASKAYVSNLKTGRGPSIEQVLDNAPPNMNEVLEKLRPFGNI